MVLFNIVGWAFNKTKIIHFISVVLVFFSWIFLGFFYGFGYCFLTDWHYQVRLKIGKDMSGSFISFVVNDTFGLNVPESIIDIVTGVVFGAVFILGVVNFIVIKKRRLK